MKPLRWPTTQEKAQYMKERQIQNRINCVKNRNENWMKAKLAGTGFKWTRQAQWGYRLFDFWCHELGIAIEVDGPEHNKHVDNYRDEYNFRRSGIIVLHVRNNNDGDADEALAFISKSDKWSDRRNALGLNLKTKAGRRRLVSGMAELFPFEP